MVDAKGIEPHVPVWERWQRNDQTLSNSEFQWDEQADEYRCPQGHSLCSQRRAFKNPRTHVTKANTIIYRASQSDCTRCPMKERCCPRTPVRKIVRSIHEAARDVARRIRTTVRYQRSRSQRKKVEILFAHLKRILKLDRLRYGGSAVPATNSHWLPRFKIYNDSPEFLMKSDAGAHSQRSGFLNSKLCLSVSRGD
jgi:hypothetical protein